MIYQPYSPSVYVTVQELYSLHYFHFQQGYTFPGERHDFWELVYADMGSVTLGDDDRAFALSTGYCCIHAPNHFHQIRADLGPRSNLFVISFGADSAALEIISGRPIALDADARRLIRQMVNEARALCGPVLDISSQSSVHPLDDAPYGSGQMIQSALQLLLLMLLRQELSETPQAPRRVTLTEETDMQSILGVCEDYLRAHLDGTIRMEDICRHAGIGATSLKRLYRQTVNAPVMEHYQTLRLQEACRLIRTGAYTLTQVAAELGYSSLAAFSRQFRRMLGITPSDYMASVSDTIDSQGNWHSSKERTR
ncbi:MAG: helix-turn-helix transcriptional regulator [Clostridia bacterium]|nr:helix-turn-helix transcriptional regulator [Clostridia bacterium]